MRFLCLHGFAANSRILELQFLPLKSRLPSDWEFVYLDGEHEGEALKGATNGGGIFPGPYYSWFHTANPEEIKSACEYVLDVVREEGPFDGVIAYSQGCQLLATILCDQAERNPEVEVFKMAVFFFPIMPFDLSAGKLSLTYDGVDDVTVVHEDANGVEVPEDTDWLIDPRTAGFGIISDGVVQEFQRLTSASTEPITLDAVIRYHPSQKEPRIHIPNVHILGLQDEEWGLQGKQFAALCDHKLTKVVFYDGAHQIPRSGVVLDKVVEAIYWAIERMSSAN